jgi:uncharacterized protein (TIGR03089 family)
MYQDRAAVKPANLIIVTARTVGAMFAAVVAIDPTRPLLTYYDDDSGERTELSGATLTNWVAKTANMIADDCGLGVGNRASVGLPPHWQSAAVLLGCWTAGLEVVFAPEPAEVAFVVASAANHDWPAAERYALGLHPMALPLREVPDGYLDFNTEVRAHGDHFYPATPAAPDDPALPDYTHEQVCAMAADRADTLGLRSGRVLIDAGVHPDPVEWLLAPLAAGSSIVLCRNLDSTKIGGRAASERVTQRLI